VGYDNSMQGVLFKNEKKTSDKHPVYKGEGEVGGREVWISAWVNESQKGEKYMKLKFEYKDESGGGSAAVSSDAPADNRGLGAAAAVAADDDIPF
jgi:hypothetical protein